MMPTVEQMLEKVRRDTNEIMDEALSALSGLMPRIDYVTVEDFESAINILRFVIGSDENGTFRVDVRTADPAVSDVCRAWRFNAINSLNAKLEARLRGQRPIRTDADVHAVLKTIALHLQDASVALLASADRMNKKGDSVGANTAYRAHQAAKAQAEEFLGGD